MIEDVCSLFLLLVYFISPVVISWEYDHVKGSSVWSENYPQCSGQQQSPINIQHDEVWFNRALTAFETPGYESIPRNAHWELQNTGHSIQIFLNGEYVLSDGGLEGKYKAAYLEFHWGHTDAMGSEHTINGEHSAMEVHLVHHSTACGSFDEALLAPRGIAILSFLFKAHKVDNFAYKQILSFLPNITHKGDSIPLRPLPLLSLLPVNLNDYYRYEGSLTHPPCAENVIWTLFNNQIFISFEQMRQIRETLFATQREDPRSSTDPTPPPPSKPRPLTHTCRDVQPLNGRTVYSSNPDDATMFSHPLSSPMSITMAVFCGMLVLLMLTKNNDPANEHAE